MAYIDIDELKSLVPESVMCELSDDVAGGVVDDDLIATVINEACEEVDGYLRNRYALPFAHTPTLVKKCAKQIARYALYERRPEGFDLPSAVIEGRKVAVKNLEYIRDGKISLGMPDNLPNPKSMVADDAEFAVRVRPSRQNQSMLGDWLDCY